MTPPEREYPHWLIVRDGEWDSLEVEHYPECWVDGGEYLTAACHVGHYETQEGPDGFFVNLDNPHDCYQEKLRPGRYLIETWEIVYNEYYGPEYDGGLRLVYPEEAQP